MSTKAAVESWKQTLARVSIHLPFNAGFGEITSDGHDVFLGVWFDAPDVDTQIQTRIHSTWALPSYLDSERQRVGWLRAQWRNLLLHELDESLRIDGKLLRDPHVTIGACPDHENCTITEVTHDGPTRYACSQSKELRPSWREWQGS